MSNALIQILVFVGVTFAIALVTYLHCRGKGHRESDGQVLFDGSNPTQSLLQVQKNVC